MVGILTFLFVLIEIPVLLIIIVVSNVAKAAGSGSKNGAKKTVAKSSNQKKSAELSEEQREKIVKAILEDSLLENDSAFDSLMYEGEANYPAADACQCTTEEFNLQYGSKSWVKAWQNALSMWFDCQSEYANDGMFRLYGKEV